MATIAQRIEEGLKIRGMKQIDLVNLTGIGKSSISTYLTGEYEPKQRNIYKIAKALNVSEAWLMGLDVPMERAQNIQNIGDEVIQIPVYGKISAGLPIEMQTDSIIDHIYIEKSETKRGKFFALEVVGDSMDKIIPNGSRVVVRQQEELENGEIGVIAINGYEATVNRYERDNDNVYLYPESNNPEHRVQRYSLKETPVSILGKVEGYHKKL